MDKIEFRKNLNQLLPESVETGDLEKLIGSEIIAEMFQFSVGHMVNFGDSTYILRLLSIFERSKYFSVLLDWVLYSASLTYEVVGDAIVLKKALDKRAGGSTIVRHLQMNRPGSTLKDITKLVNDAKKIDKDNNALKRVLKGKRVIHVKKSTDLMDSRLMYAGSYGAGKRR